MIEGDIINLSEMQELFPKIEIYYYPKIQKIFYFFYLLNKYKPNNQYLFLILKFLYFFQIVKYSILGTPVQYQNLDTFIKTVNYFKYFLFPQDFINSKESFYFFYILGCLIVLIQIILLIYLFIKMNNNPKIILIKIFSSLSLIIINYLLSPLTHVFALGFVSKAGKHIYTKEKLHSPKFLIISIISVINLFFIIIFSVLLSFFFNEVGAINKRRIYCRVNSNYEIYSTINSLLIYIIGFIHYNYYPYNAKFRDAYRIFILLSNILLYIYFIFNVYFYDSKINIFILCGYGYNIWICICIFIATICKLSELFIMVLIGIILITILSILIEHLRVDYYLFHANIYDANSIKHLEIFLNGLNELSLLKNSTDRTSIIGIINTFEDYFNSNLDNKENYYNLCENSTMQKKFGKNGLTLKIYSIIYSIYYTFVEKSNMKEDVLIRFGYFLINKLKNYCYCVYLCSKVKFLNLKQIYFKFILMEEVKEYLLEGLFNKIIEKDSYFHVEVTKVILFYKYLDDLKLKIYDAASNQVDYFDILKANNQINNKSSLTLLKIGTNLIKLRKEIIDLWDKIIHINPFCIEAEKDYLMYIENIIQDEELLKEESKKYNLIKTQEEKKKDNKYYTLFSKNNAFLLVDGYNTKGKIIYFTPNFPEVFNISAKECLSLYMNNLMPKCVSEFHDALLKDTLKFTGLKFLYKREVVISIKVKDVLYNVYVFVKILPNLSTGLIYLISFRKVPLNKVIIVTDHLFRISAMTDNINILNPNKTLQTPNSPYTFSLNKIMVGKSIILLIPDLLKYIIYEEQKYIIENDQEYIGNFFTNTQNLSEVPIYNILDKIKEHGQLLFMYESNKGTHSSVISKRKTDINIDFMEFNDIYNSCKNAGGFNFSINFKVISKSYFNDKFCFFKFYIQSNSNIQESIHNLILKESSNNLNFNYTNKNKIIHIKVKEKLSSSRQEIDGLKIKDKKNNNKLNNKNSILLGNLKKNKFNKIKNETKYLETKHKIITKKIPKFLINLSFTISIFSITTFILITLNNLSIDKKFKLIQNYLNQNLYFNNSKIQSGILYIITSEFLLYRLGFGINETLCEGNNCLDIYIESLKDVLIDLKNGLTMSLNFDYDFSNIIFSNQTKFVYSDKNNPPEEEISDVYSLLYFRIADSLKIIDYYQDYINGNDIIDVEIHNSLLNVYEYLFNDLIGYGYYGDKKIEKMNEKRFCINYIYLIINSFVYIVTFFYAVVFIIRKYKNEIYYLEKIINFQTDDFDKYLKYLEELKKKLKNETNEKEDEEDNKKLSKRTLSKEKNTEKEEEKKKITKSKKDKKAKTIKLFQQKNEKKRVMSKYFLNQNLLAGYKIGTIFILAMSYYLLIYFIYKMQKNRFLKYDDIQSEIISSALNALMEYSKIKHEIVEYGVFLTDYLLCNEKLNMNKELYCILNYTYYTSENISEAKYVFYFKKINNIYESKEKENLMLSLLNKNNYEDNSIIGQLARIHIGDMCKGISYLNYTYCSNYWDSILLQGLNQATIYAENLLKKLLNGFNDHNENISNFNLKNILDSFYSIDIYVISFFFPAVKREAILFDSLKDNKIKGMLKIFNALVYISAVEIIILYSTLMLSIYQMRDTNSLMNFVIIFPLKYVHEKNDFYNDILYLNDGYF